MKTGTFTVGQVRKKTRHQKHIRRILIILGAVLIVLIPIVVYLLTTPVRSDRIQQLSQDVWVQNSGAGLYGRVNISSLELRDKETISKATPYSNGTILHSNATNLGNNQGISYITGGGEALPINNIRPQNIEANKTENAVKVAGSATNIVTAGKYVGLLDGNGNVYLTTIEQFGSANSLTPINSEDQRALSIAVARNGEVAMLLDNGQVWIKTLDDAPKESKHSIQDMSKNFDTNTLDLTFSKNHWAVHYKDAEQSKNKLWIDGNEVDGFVPNMKFAPPIGEETIGDNIYIVTPDKLLRIDGDGRQNEVQKIDEEYTAVTAYAPTNINGSDQEKCNDGSLKVIAIWESDNELLSSVCGKFDALPYSKMTSSGVATGGRGVKVFSVNDKIVLNAAATGEVWVMPLTSEKWTVIKSTLNNWHTELDREEAQENTKTPDKNVCPSAPDMRVFGVRPDQDNFVPVLLPVVDANQGDVLSIVGDVKQSNDDLGKFRVVNNGQALAVFVTANGGSSPRSTQVTIEVSDGGTDATGACRVPITFTIEEHPYSMPNQAPKHIGADIPNEHLMVAPYPATSSVDALTGWYDPDGDSIYAVPGTTPEHGLAVVSASGVITFQPENVAPGDFQNVAYTVQDAIGAKVPTATQFRVSDSGVISLDTITRSAPIKQNYKVDMKPFVHGTQSSWVLSVENVPDGVSATVDPTGQSISINASKAGEYTITYILQGASKTGSIHFVAVDEAVVNNLFTVDPMTALVQNEEDIVIDIKSAVQNVNNAKWAVKETTITPKRDSDNSVIADISADVTSSETVRLDAFLTKTSNQAYTNIGRISVIIAVENIGDITAYIDLVISSSPDGFAPIAVTDQVSVHPGETIDIDVLSNDVSAMGQSILLDPRLADEEDVNKQGFAFPSGDKIRYIAPSDAVPGDILSRDYWIYTAGHTQTGRSHGYLNIVIADPETTLDNSYSGQKSPEDDLFLLQHEKEATFALSDVNVKPVGFRNIEYGANGDEVVVKPLDNDIVPDGQYAKVVKASQIPPTGASTELEPKTITDENDLQSLHLVIGETGDITVWDITVNTFSDGTLAKYGEKNSKVTTYSERIVLRTTIESVVPNYPQIKDTKVKTSEIERRSTFHTNIDKAISYAGGNNFEYSVIMGNDISMDGTKVNGNMSQNSQVMLYKATLRDSGNDEGKSAIKAYGFVRVPSLALIIPTRKDLAVKTVQVGQGDLVINVNDEIEPLDGASLSVSEELNHAKKRPQATCQISGNTIRYTPNRMRPELTTDTDVIDSCGVYVSWDGEPNTRTLITFQIAIIPEATEPTIKDGVALEALAPKESSSTNLHEYINWWGHSDEEIASLHFTCTIDGDVTASCQGLTLQLSVPRTATELISHTIHIVINDHQSKPADWTLKIKAGAKRGDIEVPVHSQTLVIREKQDPPSVNVLNDVKDWLARPEFYDFQTGGTITCAPQQDPKVHCAEVNGSGSGELKFTVTADAQDTGFLTLGRYIFTDRAPDNAPNRGTGTVKIDYQALPKQPPPPDLNMQLARSGLLEFTVRESSATIPQATQICIVVDGREVCKPHTEDGSQKFRTDSDLSFLQKWKEYSFTAVIKNEVGSSPASNLTIGTPFEPLKAPTVKWRPENTGNVKIVISGADPETEKFQVMYNGVSVEVAKSGDGAVYNIPGLAPMTQTSVSVIGISHPVTSGTETFVAARSETKTVSDVIVPKLVNNAALDLSANSDGGYKFDMTNIVNVDFKAIKGVKYQYRWHGDCETDGSWQDYIGSPAPTAICSKSLLDSSFNNKEVTQSVDVQAIFIPSAFNGEVDGSQDDIALFTPATVTNKGIYKTLPSAGPLAPSDVHYCIKSDNISAGARIELSTTTIYISGVPYSLRIPSPSPPIPTKTSTKSVAVELEYSNGVTALQWMPGYTVSSSTSCASYLPSLAAPPWTSETTFKFTYDKNTLLGLDDRVKALKNFTPSSIINGQVESTEWQWSFERFDGANLRSEIFDNGNFSSSKTVTSDLTSIPGYNNLGVHESGQVKVCITFIGAMSGLKYCSDPVNWSFATIDSSTPPVTPSSLATPLSMASIPINQDIIAFSLPPAIEKGKENGS